MRSDGAVASHKGVVIVPQLVSEFSLFFRTCPKSDPRFKPLIQQVTQNFDTFDDYGSNLEKDAKEGKLAQSATCHSVFMLMRNSRSH